MLNGIFLFNRLSWTHITSGKFDWVDKKCSSSGFLATMLCAFTEVSLTWWNCSFYVVGLVFTGLSGYSFLFQKFWGRRCCTWLLKLTGDEVNDRFGHGWLICLIFKQLKEPCQQLMKLVLHQSFRFHHISWPHCICRRWYMCQLLFKLALYPDAHCVYCSGTSVAKTISSD